MHQIIVLQENNKVFGGGDDEIGMFINVPFWQEGNGFSLRSEIGST